MRYPLLATQLYGIPLLLDPEKAAVIESVFRAYASGNPSPLAEGERPAPMAAAYAAPRFAGKPYTVTEAGVAVLPIIGTMVHRGSMMDAMSGLTSYTAIENLFDAATTDADVKGILLEVDSTGGQADGAFALGEKIRAGTKPVWASVNEKALSGGYLLACAADHVTMTKTGRVGSIGVIALHQDRSKANAKAGITYTAIHAGAKKNFGTPHEPLSDPARADMQAMVDGLNDHFVAYAAQMRDMDPDAVRALDAGVLTGQAAIDAGLVNSIMSFQDTLAAFETKVSGGARLTNGGFRQLPHGGTTMSKDAQSAAVETPTAEQVAAQVAAAQASGAAQMQARIKDIQTCDEAKGRSKLAAHLAFNTAMGLDDAKALLAASAVEVAEAAGQASALAAGMAQLSNPAVGSEAAAASDPNPQAEAAAVWNRSNAKLRAVK
jgi:signal peptide peptidase SppA